MMQSVSPVLRKCIALVIFVVAVWSVGVWLIGLGKARYALSADIEQLRLRHVELLKRRVQIGALEESLSQAEASSGAGRRAIVADAERPALAQLQQFALTKIKEVSATALAISQIGARDGRTAGTVSLSFRVRGDERALAKLIAALEGAEMPIWLDDLSLVARSPANTSAAGDVEMTAVLRSPWIGGNRSKP